MHGEGASQDSLATRAIAQSLMGDRSCGVVEGTMPRDRRESERVRDEGTGFSGSGKGKMTTLSLNCGLPPPRMAHAHLQSMFFS